MRNSNKGKTHHSATQGKPLGVSIKKILKTLLFFSLLQLPLSLLATENNFILNPTNIRETLLTNNNSLLMALNNVERTKLDVNSARAKLLPSINLGILLPALSNPTFLLSSVTFLFPFLVPSNWAVVKQQESLLKADKEAFNALELNLLGSALSLYYTYLNDLKVHEIYENQNRVLETMYQSLKKQSDILGNVTNEDLSMAAAGWEESKYRLSKLTELLIAEKASLRVMLSLPLDAKLSAEYTELSEGQFESVSIQELLDRSSSVAPEMRQLQALIKAAESLKFSKTYGFLTSASISGNSNNGNSPFESLKLGANFSFGMDNLVSMKIGENNLDMLKLRENQLIDESGKSAEILIGQIDENKKQQAIANEALINRLKVFNGQKRQYQLGLISLQSLLLTESQLTESLVRVEKSRLDLNLSRISILRLAIDGDFSKVTGCKNSEMKKPVLFGKIFKKSESLDKICR